MYLSLSGMKSTSLFGTRLGPSICSRILAAEIAARVTLPASEAPPPSPQAAEAPYYRAVPQRRMRAFQYVKRVGLFARESPEVVQYKCLDHERDYSNVGSNVELLIDAVAGRHDYASEGLSTVDYTVVFEELKTIYSAGTDPHDAVEEGKPKKSRNKRKAQGKALGGQQRTHFPCTHIKVDF